jgi:hypothetical protein
MEGRITEPVLPVSILDRHAGRSLAQEPGDLLLREPLLNVRPSRKADSNLRLKLGATISRHPGIEAFSWYQRATAGSPPE